MNQERYLQNDHDKIVAPSAMSRLSHRVLLHPQPLKLREALSITEFCIFLRG